MEEMQVNIGLCVRSSKETQSRHGEMEVERVKFKTIPELERDLSHKQNNVLERCSAIKIAFKGWRDGSVVKSTDCFTRGLSSITSNHMVAHNHLSWHLMPSSSVSEDSDSVLTYIK